MAANTSTPEDVVIEVITQPEDFCPAFEICAKAFGKQTADGIWTIVNPGWDTPEGQAQGAARMERRWRATKDAKNTRFLKASLSTGGGAPQIVGVAIWIHASLIAEHGDVPEPLDVADLYANDARTQNFLAQSIGSLHMPRQQVLEEKARSDSIQKSVMVLDLCAADPDFQRRGIATKLVQWGLEEARRLGDIEAICEASRMGRSVYKKLGFKEVGEIQYEVDEEFKDRSLPSNVFLRTRPLSHGD